MQQMSPKDNQESAVQHFSHAIGPFRNGLEELPLE